MALTAVSEALTPPPRMKESWDSIEGMCVNLAGQIEQHTQETGEQFDMMIYIPRGGLFVVNIVARELGFDGTEVFAHVNTMYKGEIKGEARQGQKITQEQAEGKNALLVEEVVDTGETMDRTFSELKDLGIALLRVGALHVKDHSVFDPDWAVKRTSGKTWIDYPWEPHDKAGEHSKVKRPSFAETRKLNASANG